MCLFFTLQMLAQQAGYYFKRPGSVKFSHPILSVMDVIFLSLCCVQVLVLTHKTLCYVDSSLCLEYATKCASYRHLLLFFLFFRR